MWRNGQMNGREMFHGGDGGALLFLVEVSINVPKETSRGRESCCWYPLNCGANLASVALNADGLRRTDRDSIRGRGKAP